MLKQTILLAAVAGMVLAMAATSANAALLTSSATAPTIDGDDIASFGASIGKDKWWPEPAYKYGEPGLTVGQTFTTGNAALILNAFTFQVEGATEPTKEYVIRVGTVSEDIVEEVTIFTFTEIASEPATQSAATAADDYWTWTLDSPVSLAANTVYGVDVGMLSSTSEWTTGIGYVYYTADEYPDGTRFRSGTAGYGVGDTTMHPGYMSGDRIFHVDLVPEPATMALLALGGIGLVLRRKRR